MRKILSFHYVYILTLARERGQHLSAERLTHVEFSPAFSTPVKATVSTLNGAIKRFTATFYYGNSIAGVSQLSNNGNSV